MAVPWPTYRPIADYALIGNTHSAALIGTDGSIDWCCLPHFDSGAMFCRLLDVERGGYFRVAPVEGRCAARHYSDGSPILEMEFEAAAGRVRIVDFMHNARLVESRLGLDHPHSHRLLRRVEGLAGEVELELAFRPTFDFARAPARIEPMPGGVLVKSLAERVALRVIPPCRLEVRGDTVFARLRVRAGERLWLVVSYADATSGDDALDVTDPEALLDETRRHWAEWESRCPYDGPFAAELRLSARVLKLLTFGPTGALIAAPTTSLPEAIGGVRNWDYRFCWLRDASLVLRALMALGYHESAADFFVWLENLCIGECGQLQIMYRLDGGRVMAERELAHLSGYRDSPPVRTGNAAAAQTQLDIYGHVLDSAFVCLEGMQVPIRPDLLRVLGYLADQAALRWREEDEGLWEARCEPRHFVSSKLMCWVALDRAVRLVANGKLHGDVRRWSVERDACRRAILERGFDRVHGTFTQVLGGSDLDASVLLMPMVGFLPAADPRMRATVERIRAELGADGLVYRYRGGDGIAGDEATFAMCTYWLAENLVLQGRLDEAAKLVERVGSFASDLGLLSEEIDPVHGELLGNYPQGFTHLALILSVLTLDRALRGKR